MIGPAAEMEPLGFGRHGVVRVRQGGEPNTECSDRWPGYANVPVRRTNKWPEPVAVESAATRRRYKPNGIQDGVRVQPQRLDCGAEGDGPDGASIPDIGERGSLWLQLP